MSPLIAQSADQTKIERDLSRFTDASSDLVPVCVMGNYSSGKSTFINALIGSEILPNGSNPVTAKIYKITRSKFNDRASIKFTYCKQQVYLIMTAEDTYFENLLIPNILTNKLTEHVVSMSGETIALRMHKAISIINDFEDDNEENEISDLIEVEIPFINGVLAKSQHPFVIFDTPGSNSASNSKHLKVLKQAMANMTNGLPIFLATPDTLDSVDNENLYKIIRDLDELDSRFTMIVVNKADKNDLNRKESTVAEEKIILRQAIPRNLYSGGIFYVSSIIGLGSKNNGEFIDDFYAETYEDQEHKYKDPENKRYKQLYVYNIMPAQIKKRADSEAKQESNLIFANSGLFSIETEIESFAGKYAAYNKCFQSQLFLYHVIELTQESINKTKKETEEARDMIHEKLEEDKHLLLEQLENSSEEKKSIYQAEYSEYIVQFTSGVDATFSRENLEKHQDEFNKNVELEMGFDQHVENVKKEVEEIGPKLVKNIQRVVKDKNMSSLGNVFNEAKSDLGAIVKSNQIKNETKQAVDKKVADQMTIYAREKYTDKLREIYELMNQGSQDYWTSKTEDLRKALARIVTGSDVLTADRREELEKIIIEYQQLTFDENHVESIFRKENLEKKLAIGDFVLWHSNQLNLDKLAKTYNENMKDDVKNRCEEITLSHRESAFLWIDSLLNEIRTNIVDYSPELSKQAKIIQNLTIQIEDLLSSQEILKSYTVKLAEMMDWKVRK